MDILTTERKYLDVMASEKNNGSEGKLYPLSTKILIIHIYCFISGIEQSDSEIVAKLSCRARRDVDRFECLTGVAAPACIQDLAE